MAAKRKTAPKKKAPGKNIEEWQRHGTKIQFRISPAESERLITKAEGEDLTPNAYALRVLRRDLCRGDDGHE